MHTYKPSSQPPPGSESTSAPNDGEVLDYHGQNDEEGASVPLVSRQHAEQGETIFKGDNSDEEDDDDEEGIVPYAHRDLKPAYADRLYRRNM
jgi:hypothetical protein